MKEGHVKPLRLVAVNLMEAEQYDSMIPIQHKVAWPPNAVKASVKIIMRLQHLVRDLPVTQPLRPLLHSSLDMAPEKSCTLQ